MVCGVAYEIRFATSLRHSSSKCIFPISTMLLSCQTLEIKAGLWISIIKREAIENA
jgi:hypothetical protein